MVLEQERADRIYRLKVHAAMTCVAVISELPALFYLFAIWFGAAMHGRPLLALGCQTSVVAIPAVLLALALWRRYWTLISLQVLLLSGEGYVALHGYW